MKQRFLQHLVMIGIPVGVWILALLLDRVLSAGVIGLFLTISMAGYTAFAFWLAKKSAARSLFRVYPLIGFALFVFAFVGTLG